jgi:methylated-DNA-[protein]-cysteine S-methyltransferase
MIDVNLGLIEFSGQARGTLSSERGEPGAPLIEFALLDSRLGTIVLIAREKRLISLDISIEEGTVTRKRLRDQYPGASESLKPFDRLQRLLDRFLRGKKVDFDIPFDLRGLGDFSRRVLLEVKGIPYGAVTSYGAIGRRLGYPSAGRAVGQAVGRNPIPIVIPCHRVIRSDGLLGGFSMGLNLKKRLLALEGIQLPQEITDTEDITSHVRTHPKGDS